VINGRKQVCNSFLDALKILKKLIFTSQLFHASFLLTAMGICTGILGYIYQILVGRLLGPIELGLFSAVISLTTIFSAPLGAITLIVAKKISFLKAKENYEELKRVGKKYLRAIAFGSLIFITVMYLIQDFVLHYLNSSNNFLFCLFVGMVIMAALLSLNNAFFQGLQMFNWYVGLGFTWALLKIICVFYLVSFLEFGVNGATSGALLSQLIIWLIGIYILCKYFISNYSNIEKIKFDKSDSGLITIKSSIVVIIASTSFVIMTQVDVVLANHFFSPLMASQYSAAAILGKAVLYVPGGLVFALFPMVVSNDANHTSSVNLIKQAIFITTILCIPICLFYYFFGGDLVSFFYGDKYPQAGELLGYLGFAFFPMSMLMVMEHFLLAKGRLLFSLIFVILVPLQILAAYLWHESLFQLVGIIFMAGSIAIVLGFVVLWSDIRNQKSKI
jgi:O-antigen/teichoic acid export membrane protein